MYSLRAAWALRQALPGLASGRRFRSWWVSSHVRASAWHSNTRPPADKAVSGASRAPWIRLGSLRSVLDEAQPSRSPLFGAPCLFPSCAGGLEGRFLCAAPITCLLQFALQLDAGALILGLLLMLEAGASLGLPYRDIPRSSCGAAWGTPGRASAWPASASSASKIRGCSLSSSRASSSRRRRCWRAEWRAASATPSTCTPKSRPMRTAMARSKVPSGICSICKREFSG